MKTIILTLLAVVCLTTTAQTTAVKEHVDPLLTTEWGQDAPYNLLCPEKPNSQGEPQHCRVGCVACAMGQVMNFHQYPAVGIGQGTNIFNTSLTVNYGDTHYDWAHMQDSYRDAYTDEEATAVATLLYHCGVAVNMIYGLQSSSTFTAFANNMTTALVRYFGYDDTDLKSVSRSKYTRAEWLQLIYENLSAGQPIIYSGNSSSMGGHTWVLDGYDREGRVHMNWGWLGRDNGYYDIDLNIPGLDFNQQQSMVIGIRPPHTDTGIARTTSAPAADAVWHTLDGRTVVRPVRRGIYISNGKKYVIH